MIVSERSINLQMRPMVDGRGRSFNINNTNMYAPDFIPSCRGFTARSDSRWDYNCYRLIDYISSVIKKRIYIDYGNIRDAYDKRLEFLPLLKDPLLVYNFNRDLELGLGTSSVPLYTRFSFTSTVKDIRNSPIFKGINNSELYTAIDKASSCKINVKYQYKVIKDNKSKYSEFDYSSDFIFYNLFNVEQLLGPQSKDGKYYNRSYKFSFDTPLGCLFIHNMLCAGWCKIDDHFYELSKYANFLFRINFLPFNNIPIKLSIQKTLKSLGITEKTPSVRKKKFFKFLNELRDFKFIDVTSVDGDEVICARTKKRKKKTADVIPIGIRKI